MWNIWLHLGVNTFMHVVNIVCTVYTLTKVYTLSKVYTLYEHTFMHVVNIGGAAEYTPHPSLHHTISNRATSDGFHSLNNASPCLSWYGSFPVLYA